MSTLSGKPLISGLPSALGVELTNHCNLRCPECACGSGALTRQKGYMDIALYDRILNELAGTLFHVNLFFQGEPMMHPHFESFIRPETGIWFTMSTNGHFLGGENAGRIASSGLKKLIVSLDGMDQETYSLYRAGGDLRKVISGITDVARAKERLRSPLKIEIQFLVNRYNEMQVPQVIRFARDIRASVKLKSMQIINSGETARWMPSDEKYRRYSETEGKFVIKSSLPNMCLRLWMSPVVTWDGYVVPCCFDKDAFHVMGNLKTESFRDIWEGPRFRSFRKSVLKARAMNEICRNCSSGLREAVT